MKRRIGALAPGTGERGTSEQSEPWYTRIPWESLDQREQRDGAGEQDTIPPVLGPASRFGKPVHDPFSVQAPGLDMDIGTSLAVRLHWATGKPERKRLAPERTDQAR